MAANCHAGCPLLTIICKCLLSLRHAPGVGYAPFNVGRIPSTTARPSDVPPRRPPQRTRPLVIPAFPDRLPSSATAATVGGWTIEGGRTERGGGRRRVGQIWVTSLPRRSPRPPRHTSESPMREPRPLSTGLLTNGWERWQARERRRGRHAKPGTLYWRDRTPSLRDTERRERQNWRRVSSEFPGEKPSAFGCGRFCRQSALASTAHSCQPASKKMYVNWSGLASYTSRPHWGARADRHWCRRYLGLAHVCKLTPVLSGKCVMFGGQWIQSDVVVQKFVVLDWTMQGIGETPEWKQLLLEISHRNFKFFSRWYDLEKMTGNWRMVLSLQIHPNHRGPSAAITLRPHWDSSHRSINIHYLSYWHRMLHTCVKLCRSQSCRPASQEAPLLTVGRFSRHLLTAQPCNGSHLINELCRIS